MIEENEVELKSNNRFIVHWHDEFKGIPESATHYVSPLIGTPTGDGLVVWNHLTLKLYDFADVSTSKLLLNGLADTREVELEIDYLDKAGAIADTRHVKGYIKEIQLGDELDFVNDDPQVNTVEIVVQEVAIKI